jgi:hypothetical protein
MPDSRALLLDILPQGLNMNGTLYIVSTPIGNLEDMNRG